MARRTKFIYAMVATNGMVKIGCSGIPERRLMAVAVWSPLRLELVATTPGNSTDEAKLQDMLAHSHSHHEWFHPTPEVSRVIALMKIGTPIAAILESFTSCPVYRPLRVHARANRIAASLDHAQDSEAA